jgi:hypothetical protein
MKLNVILDKMGNIVGSSQVGTVKTDEGTEIETGVIAGSEQSIYEIEVDDNIMKRSNDEIQQEIRKMLSSKLGNNPWFRKK